jgi:hypothetical protein
VPDRAETLVVPNSPANGLRCVGAGARVALGCAATALSSLTKLAYFRKLRVEARTNLTLSALNLSVHVHGAVNPGSAAFLGDSITPEIARSYDRVTGARSALDAPLAGLGAIDLDVFRQTSEKVSG